MIALGADRVALVRHRRGALLAGGERLFDLAHLGFLQAADLGREALETGPGDRDRREQHRMAVARHDLGGDVLAPQPQPLHHPRLDRGRDRGVGADGARELAEGELRESVLETGDVAVGLEGEAGQPQAEGGGLGVDAVGAADAERVAVLQRPRDQGVAVGSGAGDDDLPGPAQLQRQRRVEHVGGGEAVVDPAPVLANRAGDDVDEGGDVVVGDPLALVDRRDRERRVGPRRLGGLARHHALLGPGLGRRQLDLEPGLHLALGRPDLTHLRARVAGNHLPPRPPEFIR